MNENMDKFLKPTMEYDEFFSWLLEDAFNEDNMKALNIKDVVPHAKGERAFVKGSSADTFIRQTNVKYYGKESNVLMGDFLEVKMTPYKERNSFLRFSVEELYNAYSNAGVAAVMDVIENHCTYSCGIDARVSRIFDAMEKYEDIKPYLIIRPLNYPRNEEMLKGMTFKLVGDISLVLYAVVFDDAENGCLNTCKIPDEIFRAWNRTFDEVFNDALRNTNGFAVPQMFTNILDTEDYESFMEEGYSQSITCDCMPLVTTSRKTNGAIVMFYDGVCKKIAEMYGGSFYVAFTSIHEAMLHKEGSMDVDSIKRHLRATNKAFGPQDTLTDEVWYYNAGTDTFSMVI